MSRRGIVCRICGAHCACRKASLGMCCGCHRHKAHKQLGGGQDLPVVHIGEYVQDPLAAAVEIEAVDGRPVFDISAWPEVERAIHFAPPSP